MIAVFISSKDGRAANAFLNIPTTSSKLSLSNVTKEEIGENKISTIPPWPNVAVNKSLNVPVGSLNLLLIQFIAFPGKSKMPFNKSVILSSMLKF